MANSGSFLILAGGMLLIIIAVVISVVSSVVSSITGFLASREEED